MECTPHLTGDPTVSPPSSGWTLRPGWAPGRLPQIRGPSGHQPVRCHQTPGRLLQSQASGSACRLQRPHTASVDAESQRSRECSPRPTSASVSSVATSGFRGTRLPAHSSYARLWWPRGPSNRGSRFTSGPAGSSGPAAPGTARLWTAPTALSGSGGPGF